MKNDDNPSTIKRFLNWFFPKKLYDPLDKKVDHESKPLNLEDDNAKIEKKLEKLRNYIKIDKEVDSLSKKYNKSSEDENGTEDEIDLL